MIKKTCEDVDKDVEKTVHVDVRCFIKHYTREEALGQDLFSRALQVVAYFQAAS